jgi:type VI secretion system protein ImpH
MRNKNPNKIDTDFKAATIAAEMIENDLVAINELLVLPIGPQKRAYDKEIAGITKKQSDSSNKHITHISVNRDGFYDMLPEGLFHKAPASSVMITEEDMIKDIRERRAEEKQARRFFAPFEAEINYLKTIIELYENRVDKKNEYDDLINIFLKEWSEFKCFTNKQMLILIHVLPVIHEQRNNLAFVSSILRMMFKIPIVLTYKTGYATGKKGDNKQDTVTSGNVLGVNFIAGQLIEPEESLQISIGPLSAAQMMHFLPGSSAVTAIDVLLSYFIPMQTDTQVELLSNAASQKLVIGGKQVNSILGYTTYLGN